MAAGLDYASFAAAIACISPSNGSRLRIPDRPFPREIPRDNPLASIDQ
ncbi:MAG: hypothetical protein ACKO38_19440 [Planctomycetota bacterium]